VSGFGSIFVGGVEFDDAQATVLDDEGIAIAPAGNTVRLGMTVEVQGGDVSSSSNGPAASASTIQ
jgi:hypothetical protein